MLPGSKHLVCQMLEYASGHCVTASSTRPYKLSGICPTPLCHRETMPATTSTSGLVAKLQTMKDRKAVAHTHFTYYIYIYIYIYVCVCVCVLCECNIYTATSVLVDLILCERILKTSHYYCTRSGKSIILVPYFYQQYVQH